MKMLNGNILCLNEAQSINNKNNAGFIIPESAKSYKVLKVVKGDNVSEGSLIYVPSHAGIEVKVDGDKYEIVGINDIILILD